MFRSHAGTHPVLVDIFPRNCINCGAPVDLHDQFPCPNYQLTPKELGKFRRVKKRKLEDIEADLAQLMKEWKI